MQVGRGKEDDAHPLEAQPEFHIGGQGTANRLTGRADHDASQDDGKGARDSIPQVERKRPQEQREGRDGDAGFEDSVEGF